MASRAVFAQSHGVFVAHDLVNLVVQSSFNLVTDAAVENDLPARRNTGV